MLRLDELSHLRVGETGTNNLITISLIRVIDLETVIWWCARSSFCVHDANKGPLKPPFIGEEYIHRKTSSNLINAIAHQIITPATQRLRGRPSNTYKVFCLLPLSIRCYSIHTNTQTVLASIPYIDSLEWVVEVLWHSRISAAHANTRSWFRRIGRPQSRYTYIDATTISPNMKKQYKWNTNRPNVRHIRVYAYRRYIFVGVTARSKCCVLIEMCSAWKVVSISLVSWVKIDNKCYQCICFFYIDFWWFFST